MTHPSHTNQISFLRLVPSGLFPPPPLVHDTKDHHHHKPQDLICADASYLSLSTLRLTVIDLPDQEVSHRRHVALQTVCRLATNCMAEAFRPFSRIRCISTRPGLLIIAGGALPFATLLLYYHGILLLARVHFGQSFLHTCRGM